MTQREMPIIGPTEQVHMLPMAWISACRSRHQAIQLCVQASGLTNMQVAHELGIDRGQFTRIMSGTAHFPDRLDDDLMRVCRNYAPMQYSAWRFGFDLQEKGKDARIRELQAELDALQEDIA